MAADLHDLRLRLRERLAAMTNFPGASKVAAENRPFVPPTDGTLWLREALAHGEERLTSTRMTMLLGIYWVYVHGPAGKGTEAVEDLSKNVAEAFPMIGSAPSPGLHFYRVSRQEGRQERFSVQSGAGEGVWYTIPVLVYFRLFTAVP